MLPTLQVHPKSASRWHRSTRRLSLVKLPVLLSPSPTTSHPPDPFPTVPPVPVTVPSLCIDNRYFEGYCSSSSGGEQTEMERMTAAFRGFAKIHGELHRQRQNYFEKRGLEDAIQHNIDQQNAKIGQTIECLTVCEEITKKYNCSLNNSFQILIDEFAAKTFSLTSCRAVEHTCHVTTSSNEMLRKNESHRISLIEWRIEREKMRIQILDEKIAQIFAKRDA